MPSIHYQPDYFLQGDFIPPTSVCDAATPALTTMNLPKSMDGSDASDAQCKVLVFSDFDGTIMLGDTGHILFDRHGCGPDRRKELDAAIQSGELSFRDASERMWSSLNVPFDDGFEVIRENLEIDPDFEDFHMFCIKYKIPFNVISAGVRPLLRRVLDEFIGEQARRIHIVANDVEISADGGEWKVIWKDDTSLGHNKAASIQEVRAQVSDPENEHPPMIIFIGDGVSDLPAARECDVLFARRGLRLEAYCIEHNIPHIPFNTFKDIECEVARTLNATVKRYKKPGRRNSAVPESKARFQCLL